MLQCKPEFMPHRSNATSACRHASAIELPQHSIVGRMQPAIPLRASSL